MRIATIEWSLKSPNPVVVSVAVIVSKAETGAAD
jgi:hypothetical protein